jgi:hypothetical protein
MRLAGHAAPMGDNRNAYRLLMGKPEGKKPVRRPRRRWVDSTGINNESLRNKMEWFGLDWPDSG